MSTEPNNPTDASPTDPLAALLRTADAVAPAPEVQGDLAGAVRRLGSRRKRRRRIATGSFAVVVVAVVGALVTRRPAMQHRNELAVVPPTTPAAVVAPSPAPAEFRVARAEADAQLALVHRLLRAERRGRSVRSFAPGASLRPPRTFELAMVRERAALTLVAQADRLNSLANSSADALATYRRAAELFPDTSAAPVARERIRTLQPATQSEEIKS